jgi:glycosyltransferase involved in cell wall biosynthesis
VRSEKKGINIHLHIIGKIDSSDYVAKLRRLSGENSEWVYMEGGKFGKEKNEVLAKHKFGIHGRPKEAFGIAVAEMVKAGCIPFVPDDGGQTEIINHPALLYGSVEDGVNRIESVLENNEMQAALREHLAKQAEKFSAETFMSEIREVVRDFLKENVKF